MEFFIIIINTSFNRAMCSNYSHKALGPLKDGPIYSFILILKLYLLYNESFLKRKIYLHEHPRYIFNWSNIKLTIKICIYLIC